MLRKKIFIIFIILISNFVYGAKNLIINKIYFKGLQRITYKTALLNIHFNLGDSINNNDINKIIRSLYSTGNFENIKVLNNYDKLIIVVKERPIINDIKVLGNKSIKQEQLNVFFKKYKFCNGEFLNQSIIFNIENIIKDFYYSIGKYNVNINTKINKLPNNRASIKLVITEGTSVKVKQINILGNHIYSTEYLLSHFNLCDNNNLKNIFKSRKYNKEKLFQDLSYLRNLYLNNGYARFNINSTQISLSPDKKNIFITINIFEGKKYKIINSYLKSQINKKHLMNMSKILKINYGEIFNNKKIQNIEQNIRKYLNKYGYAYPDIKTNLKINDQKNNIKLYFTINKNKKFFVRKIIFIGNYKSEDKILRREIKQIEGKLLNNEILEQGKNRLNRTGYFKDVNFIIKHIPNSYNQVDVFYEVKELNTGVLNLGLGYGNENNVSFQIGINQDNLLGTGNFLSIHGIKNSSKTYAEFLFNDPYLISNGISFSNRLFYNNFKAHGTSISDYNNKSYGLDFILGFPINEFNKLSLGISYIHNELSNIQPQIAIKNYLNSIKKHFILNHYNSKFLVKDFILNYGWTYNSLDKTIFPKLGNYINFNGKITFLKSDNNFYKINIDIKKYLPLNKKRTFIFLSHGILGHGNGMFGKILPFYENFYAGGFNTIRGFHFNTIGPKAIYYNNNLLDCESKKIFCISNDTIGGNFLTMISLELIIPNPLLKDRYSNLLRTSIFLDSGTVWDSKWQNNPNNHLNKIPDYSNPKNIRFSSGIALQWMSPIGPLSFSYSYPIKKFNGDMTEPFQLNINNTW